MCQSISRSPEPESPANPTTSQPSFPTSFNQEPSSIWDIEPSKTEPDNELQAHRQKVFRAVKRNVHCRDSVRSIV